MRKYFRTDINQGLVGFFCWKTAGKLRIVNTEARKQDSMKEEQVINRMISPQSSKSIRSHGHHIISPSLHTGALHPVLSSLLPSPSLHTRGSWPCPYFYASISPLFISETLDPAHSSMLSSSLPSYKRLLTLPLKFQASIIQEDLDPGHSSLLPSPLFSQRALPIVPCLYLPPFI